MTAVSAPSITAAALRPRLPLNLASQAFVENKYEHYAWLRENAPVADGKVSIIKAKLFARYDDCVALLKDPRFIRNRSAATSGGRFPIPLPKSVELIAENMITSDDPEHKRLRGLVNQAFKPKAIAELEGRIDALTHRLLDDAEKKKRIDLMEDYALPIPTTVIQQLMGVHDTDMPRFRETLQSVTQGFNGLRILKTIFWDMPSVVRFMRELVQQKRSEPADDILTGLLQAEEEGDRLTEDEIVGMCFLLIIAGYETTSHLINNSVLTLLQYPDQLDRLRENPDLVASALEEIQRFRGPIHSSKPEYAIEDVQWRDGTMIKKGTAVMPLFGSANHDPDAFEDPETFDIGRDPNHHLSFGHGVHFCLGAQLARLETRIALRNLFDRNPDLRLAVPESELRLQTLPGWHRYDGLPIQLR